jgi:flagellar protein FliO/FliZ
MDTIDPLRFVAAFVFVVALIGLMAFALKRWGNAQGAFGQKWFTVQPAQGRLEVVEMRYIDAKRRLALVRRDGVEHLLLLADGRETVIEAGIVVPVMTARCKD